MIRGALVHLGYSLFKDGTPTEVVALGGVLEILQSALLIHDDIMDRDEYRRGEESVFYQYVNKARDAGYREPYHIGEALGVCAGDLGFFLAFGLISGLGFEESVRNKILGLAGREMSVVAVAQMLDVTSGAQSTSAGEESVLKLYRYKTGRYTFSLPLALGAIAGGGESIRKELEEIGEILGLVFQLKDDEIGLYGDEKKTGKPVGSDIKQGKKTLYSHFLFKLAGATELERLSSVYAHEAVASSEIAYVQGLVEDLGIRKLVSQRMEEYGCIAESKIKKLEAPNTQAKGRLLEMIEYNLMRTS
jgi:geranylgeranyl diphosphate synthase type I